MDSFENFVCIFIRKHPILSFNKNIFIIGKQHKLGVVAYIWETINIDLKQEWAKATPNRTNSSSEISPNMFKSCFLSER